MDEDIARWEDEGGRPARDELTVAMTAYRRNPSSIRRRTLINAAQAQTEAFTQMLLGRQQVRVSA